MAPPCSSDALASGRAASGEIFAYDLLFTRLQARDLGGKLRFTDTLVLEPGQREPRRAGLLAGCSDLATLYVLTGQLDAAGLADQLDGCVQATPGVEGGASRLPRADGAVARVLGHSSRAVQAALHQLWRIARALILGVDVPTLYRVKYGQEPRPPPQN